MAEETIGPYQILEQLGAGGMGEVYKALDSRIGRQVALKVLPESLAVDPERRRRFEQEARLAASLNHPNVMAIYDVGLNHHPPYIVTELVPGESLRTVIDKGSLPVRNAIDIAAQIAAGLAAAHSSGIVHRDLKPDNIIITPDRVAKILDFGIARAAIKAVSTSETVTLAQTSAGTVVGTAGYMSPEQALARADVDHRSDQFSLGLVLYQMLTGKQAFERPSAIQTMSAIVEDAAPPIERAIPAQLRWIVERCLAKEREGRYESTRDLARELANLRDHLSELTGVSSTEQKAIVKPRRRWPIMAVAAPAAAAMIAWCAAAVLMRNPVAADLSRYHFSPFATALSMQSFPVWSPDGKSLAFYGKPKSGPAQLYVQGVDSPTAVAITASGTPPYTAYPPFWSPDSRSLYYRCDMNNQSGMCRAPSTGGQADMVQPGALCGTISPDGRTLAWLHLNDELGSEIRTATPPDGKPAPYQPQPLGNGRFFNNPSMTFAPDGKTIAVAAALEGRGETTWVLPWPPGPAKPLFKERVDFSYTPLFSWFPDSRHAMFSTSSAWHMAELYMADSASGRYWPVLVQDRPAVNPSVSPDGSRIAYQSVLSHSDVVSVPIGDGPIETVLGSSRSEQMADVSPISPQVVYVTDRRGRQEVWLSSLADDWEKELYASSDFIVDNQPAQLVMTPAFSPDGKRIALGVKGHHSIVIYTGFVSGGTPVRATQSSDGFEGAPTWSPDGNWLAIIRVSKAGLMLAKVRPGSGEAPIELAPMSSSAVPAWSPTGEWIAYHGPDRKPWLISPDGKSKRQLPGDRGPFTWSRDGRTLYHIHFDRPALAAIDVATGKERTLRELGETLYPYAGGNPGLKASLSYDGKSVLYSVNRPRSEIWLVDGIRAPKAWYMRLLGR